MKLLESFPEFTNENTKATLDKLGDLDYSKCKAKNEEWPVLGPYKL